MEATQLVWDEAELERAWEERWQDEQRRVDELAELSAHLNAATARFLELMFEFCQASNDPLAFVAYRFGLTRREAREALRVAEALQELPVLRAAFGRGELSFTKVRALTRVATPVCEEGLVELAGALTASQLERALRAYHRVAVEQARHSHELEYVDWFFREDGSLILRARLAAEDGTLLVTALEAARDRIAARRHQERRAAVSAEAAAENNATAAGEDDAARTGDGPDAVAGDERSASLTVPDGPPRSLRLEALLALAQAPQPAPDETAAEGPRARLVVHVDAATLTHENRGRCELEHGPLLAPETARRLGCDAETVSQIEHDGLPLTVGRARRTVPPGLRRLLEARDNTTCCFPGCERRRHLQAHHRHHWAHGGHTSLDNLILLCHHHHRLVHEGGYTIETRPTGELCFRNRHGLVTTTRPPLPPPGSPDQLLADNHHHGLTTTPNTHKHGHGHPLDLPRAVTAIKHTIHGDDP